MSHFSGVDPIEKRKIQRDAESGDKILTYMQKVEKNGFYQRVPKSDTSAKKSPNQKENSTEMSNKKLRNGIKLSLSQQKRQRGSKSGKRPKTSINRS
jgi:hypothetical protein